MLIQRLISASKYGIKCPYIMEPIGICIHNTANDAPAVNEISYMQSNNYEVSFHIAVDDKEAIQGIPFNRNAWAAGDGNGQGNRKYIHIEICYSKSGGPKFIEAEKRAAKEVAALLKQYGWGIDRVKKHQDFNGKYCPHRTLDMGWQRFLNMIQAELNGTSQPSQPEPTPPPAPSKRKVDSFIKVDAYSWVKNTADYAGVFGVPVKNFYAYPSEGEILFRVSPVNRDYYPWVQNYKVSSGHYDFAGNGVSIDRVQMKLRGLSGYRIKYRVHLLGGNWLPWVYDDTDYAGIRGKTIDAIEVEIV